MALKVSVKDGKNCEKVLKIEVGQTEIEQEFSACYQAILPKAKIPGFRPGKAPLQVVAMHYRQEAREQVVKNLLSDCYRKAVQDKSLEPVGYPEIKDVKFDEKNLTFEALVEVRPKIKLNKIKGLQSEKGSVKISAEEIESALKRMQESLAQYKAVEDRGARSGDFVIADYVCMVDGKELEKRAGDWFELKEDEFLKGFSAQLEGVKPGEEREVNVTFPAEIGRKEVAGKSGCFKVSVKEIKQKVLPEMTDDLAREAGEFGSLAELKTKIEQDLKKQKERDAESVFEKALLDELVEKNKIDLPVRLVERRLEYLMEQAHQQMHKDGGHDHESEEHGKELEGMREKMRPEAERQVHLAFLLEEIAVKENIEVLEEDVKTHLSGIAERFKQPLETVEKYYSGSPEALDALRDQIRNEKTINFVKQNAKQSS